MALLGSQGIPRIVCKMYSRHLFPYGGLKVVNNTRGKENVINLEILSSLLHVLTRRVSFINFHEMFLRHYDSRSTAVVNY